ncbi:MAG: hypothetical protein IPK85_09120 [Gemmatimonadetes bacterium]|nr:hypothetical protein [Gemmatimonadota bacterium]
MSVRIPARCDSCGYTFQSPIAVPPGMRSSAFIGNKTQCPRCGGVAQIVDTTVDEQGRVKFLRTAFKVLRTPEVTREDLRRLERLLRESQEKEQQQEVVAAQAAAIRPEFGRLLKPKTAGDFYQMLGVLLMLVLWIIDKFGDPTIEINQTIINQLVQGPPAAVEPALPRSAGPFHPHATPQRRQNLNAEPTTSPERRRKAVSPKRTMRTKAWKNARCRCGSGKSQRSCCG